jgi:NitT/TauT family transport system permease protein
MKGKKFVSQYLFPALAFIGLVILWELAVDFFAIRELFLPPPSKVWAAILKSGSILLRHGLVTLNETLLGFALGVVVGIPLAIGIVYSRFLQNTIYPLIVGAQSIPKAAIAPLFLIWIGYGLASKVLVAFSITFFPVVVATATGLNAVEPEMMDLIRSLSATPLQIFRMIRLPNALPFIFTGFKVSISLAVIGAVVGEFVGSNNGLGYLILVATSELNTSLVIASVVLLSIMGIGLFSIVSVLEKILFPWYTTRTQFYGV